MRNRLVSHGQAAEELIECLEYAVEIHGGKTIEKHQSSQIMPNNAVCRPTDRDARSLEVCARQFRFAEMDIRDCMARQGRPIRPVTTTNLSNEATEHEMKQTAGHAGGRGHDGSAAAFPLAWTESEAPPQGDRAFGDASASSK